MCSSEASGNIIAEIVEGSKGLENVLEVLSDLSSRSITIVDFYRFLELRSYLQCSRRVIASFGTWAGAH